jgi:hypothetical protein
MSSCAATQAVRHAARAVRRCALSDSVLVEVAAEWRSGQAWWRVSAHARAARTASRRAWRMATALAHRRVLWAGAERPAGLRGGLPGAPCRGTGLDGDKGPAHASSRPARAMISSGCRRAGGRARRGRRPRPVRVRRWRRGSREGQGGDGGVRPAGPPARRRDGSRRRQGGARRRRTTGDAFFSSSQAWVQGKTQGLPSPLL